MSASETAPPHVLARVGTVIRGKYRVDSLLGMGGMAVDGLDNCGGAPNESCCTSLLVSGGTYNRKYSNAGLGPYNEGSPAAVSDFRLDKYEVTVGRFRKFVQWQASGYHPPDGSGKHAHLNEGRGLAASFGGYEPGWTPSDNADVAPTDVNLACDAAFQTWTRSASSGGNERRPMNCVSWAEAASFCIWDGGFLPSQAEWEYAAAGGIEARPFPWGSTPPGSSNDYAIYDCNYPAHAGKCIDRSNIAPVGSAKSGFGKYGQLDLAGNVWEWTLDWYNDYSPCTDCVDSTPTSRVFRGASYFSPPSDLAPSFRYASTFTRSSSVGFRCARKP